MEFAAKPKTQHRGPGLSGVAKLSCESRWAFFTCEHSRFGKAGIYTVDPRASWGRWYWHVPVALKTCRPLSYTKKSVADVPGRKLGFGGPVRLRRCLVFGWRRLGIWTSCLACADVTTRKIGEFLWREINFPETDAQVEEPW